MKPLVAVSGKGGTGKTTLTALLVQAFVASGVRPVLAVDADPNACLADILGVAAPGTLSQLREATRRKEDDRTAVTKVMQVDLGLNQIMVEAEGFDLLAMGQPEGPGCYCYVNSLLRDWLAKTSRNYAVCVVDNQAGMEHLSRLVTAAVDALLVVAEPTAPCARAVGKIMDLSMTLPMQVGRRIVVWNKVRGDEVSPQLRRAARDESADASVILPWNDALAQAYSDGQKITFQPREMPAVAQLARMCVTDPAPATDPS